MKLLVVFGATLDAGEGNTAVILPVSILSSRVSVKGWLAYHNISFTVTTKSGCIGGGILSGNSSVLGGSRKFVLEDAEITVVATHPSSGATESVTVKIGNVGQKEVYFD